MAALQNIRDKAGVVVAVVIGLALFAFIVGDFSGSGQALFSESKLRVLEAGGESVQIQDFENRFNDYTEYIRMTTGQQSFEETQLASIRDQVFRQMLSEIVMGAEYKASGLGVSPEEIFDLVQGSDPHPFVRQLFTDPQTGVFDKSLLLQFLKNMDMDPSGAQRKFWLNVERDIVNQRLATKYTQLMAKGLYVPAFLAKNDVLENEKKVTFSYVLYPYIALADSAVRISQDEIKKYYSEHQNLYEQEASLDLDFVVFNVNASEEDRAASLESIERLKEDFAATSDHESFLNLNSDQPFNPYFWKEQDLAVQIQSLFQSAPGTLIGPYEEEGAFKISKLVRTVSIPDSLRIRQILIRPSANNTAATFADSAARIRQMLVSGQPFEQVYEQYSEKDPSMPQNGEMGWLPYGQIPDTLFMIPKGGSMVLQSGEAAFILQVADRSATSKRVEVATLVKDIEPGSQTLQQIYTEASRFAGENQNEESFAKAAEAAGLQVIPAVRISPNEQIINGINASPRELIRWAYQAKPKEVSRIFDMGDQYVVAVLKKIHPEGVMPIEDASFGIRQILLKEKKAALMGEKMLNAGNDITSIAASMGFPLDTLTDVTFGSYTLPSIGMEYKVLGTAFGMKEGTLSRPVGGNNGVYLLFNQKVQDVSNAEDYMTGRTRLELTLENRASYESYEALMKLAKVKDERVKFY